MFAATCGLVFPLQKQVIIEYEPLYAVSLRFVLTTLVTLPFLRSPKGELLKLFCASTFFMVMTFSAQALAMKSLDAGVCALATQISPILLIVIGALFFKEKFKTNHMIGLGISFLGVYFVTKSPEINFENLIAPLALMLAIFSYSIGTLILRSIKLKPFQVMLWTYLLASPQLILLTTYFEKSFIRSLSETKPWAYTLSLLIGFISIGSNALYKFLVSKYPFNKIMPFCLTLPVFSILGGYILLNETIHEQAILGGCLVFLGVCIASFQLKQNLKSS